MNRQLRADIALASVTLLRGVSYLLVDIALAETEPFTLNFIRFFGAFVIAAAAFFLLDLAVFCTGTAFVAQTEAQQYTSASRAGIIFTLEPVFAAITAYFLREKD